MAHDDPFTLADELCTVREIESHRSGRRYELTPVSLIDESDAITREIERICNEPLIYGSLFADLLGGRPYAFEDAQAFLSWARVGWVSGTHFVYLILDDADCAAGAIDIKSADTSSAEIGYWLSADHGGIMTNAVVALADVAREAGYRRLHALVRPENARSAGVLERAGFESVREVENNGRTYHRYELGL